MPGPHDTKENRSNRTEVWEAAGSTGIKQTYVEIDEHGRVLMTLEVFDELMRYLGWTYVKEAARG